MTKETAPPSERSQADNFYWQVYKSNFNHEYYALAKTVPFVHFGKPLHEPWDHTLWFEIADTAEEAYSRLRRSLKLEARQP